MKALRERGAYVLVTTGVSDVGTPDIIACYRGRFYAFEVKNETGRVEKMQFHRLEQMRLAGGRGWVVRSTEGALAHLDDSPIHCSPSTADALSREEQRDEGGVHSV